MHYSSSVKLNVKCNSEFCICHITNCSTFVMLPILYQVSYRQHNHYYNVVCSRFYIAPKMVLFPLTLAFVLAFFITIPMTIFVGTVRCEWTHHTERGCLTENQRGPHKPCKSVRSDSRWHLNCKYSSEVH